MTILEMGGILMRTVWMYLFQAPGTIIIWLAKGCSKKLSITYKEHVSYSGFVGLAFDIGVIFLLVKDLKINELFNL